MKLCEDYSEDVAGNESCKSHTFKQLQQHNEVCGHSSSPEGDLRNTSALHAKRACRTELNQETAGTLLNHLLKNGLYSHFKIH